MQFYQCVEVLFVEGLLDEYRAKSMAAYAHASAAFHALVFFDFFGGECFGFWQFRFFALSCWFGSADFVECWHR
jgi:hypothetical protein